MIWVSGDPFVDSIDLSSFFAKAALWLLFFELLCCWLEISRLVGLFRAVSVSPPAWSIWQVLLGPIIIIMRLTSKMLMEVRRQIVCRINNLHLDGIIHRHTGQVQTMPVLQLADLEWPTAIVIMPAPVRHFNNNIIIKISNAGIMKIRRIPTKMLGKSLFYFRLERSKLLENTSLE